MVQELAERVMVLTIVLSRLRQKVNQDSFEAIELVGFVPTTMEKWRQGGGEENDSNDDVWENDDGVYSDANRLAQVANVTLTMPRLVGRQTCCSLQQHHC